MFVVGIYVRQVCVARKTKTALQTHNKPHNVNAQQTFKRSFRRSFARWLMFIFSKMLRNCKAGIIGQ